MTNSREFSQKSFQKLWYHWIFKFQTIQKPKILDIPGARRISRELSGKKKIRKFGYTSQGSPLFWKFRKILFFLLLEVDENSNRTFWLNGKCPWLLTNCYKNNHDITSVILVLIPHHEAVSEGTEDRLPLLNQQCVKSTIACKSPIALSLGSEMWKIKLLKIVGNLLDELRKLYMNRTVIKKFLAVLE